MTEKAGPELDAKLAEALGLGREVRLRGSTNRVRIYDPNPYYSDGSDSAEGLRRAGPKPYSTSLSIVVSAAEEWCDKQDRPTWFVLESASPGIRPRAKVRQGEVTIGKADAETLALALTLALVAALSAEPVESMKGGAR